MIRLIVAAFLGVLALAAAAKAQEAAPAYRVVSIDEAWIAGLAALAVSKDGNLIAVGAVSGTVQIWDWRRATMVSSRRIQQELISNLFFMDDDKRLTVLYSADIGEQHMYVWELATGAVADEDKVEGMGTGYFMPDGTVGMQHGSGVAFMDQKGKYANRYIEFDEYMTSVALSPDGQLIVGDGSDHYQQLVIRDAQGKLLTTIDIGFTPDDTVFSPDGKMLAVLRQENGGLADPTEFNPRTNAYHLFDVATGKQLQRFGGHNRFLSGARFSADGSRLLTWSGDQTLILWDVKSGEMIHRLEGHRDSVSDGRFLDGEKLIVSCSLDGSMKIWSAATGREIVSLHAPAIPTEPPSFIAMQPDGHFLEGGPLPLAIVETREGVESPELRGKERQALGLPAMEISAN